MHRQNNRKFIRLEVAGPIAFTWTEKDTDVCSARLCDYGHGGICFMTENFVRPDAVIKITMEEKPTDLSYFDRIHNSRARVRWCRIIPDTDAILYKTGVEFLEIRNP